MEKNYMKASSLVELELVTTPAVSTHLHGFIELLYVITGNVSVTSGEETYELKPRDVIVINANRPHSYRGSDDLLLGRFLISDARVQEMLEQNTVLFWCNSAAEDHEAFGELRQILNRILNDSVNSSRWNSIYRESLNYRLLHVLCSNFLEPQGDVQLNTGISGDEDRLQKIFSYIRSNYHHSIRLKDLADALYLSEAHVSRYIKKKLGTNFVDLVNTFRLEQSIGELIETNTPITKIAMDNGFSSTVAYDRYFKERYGMSPTDYRKKIQEERSSRTQAAQGGDTLQVREEVKAFLSESPYFLDEAFPDRASLTVDCMKSHVPFEKNNKIAIVNIGALENLNENVLQEQILSSKTRLGFKYVRFHSPFRGNIHVSTHAPVQSLNFGPMDTALDFLVQNQLKPYFELGPRPQRFIRYADDLAFAEPREWSEFDSDEQLYEFHLRFFSHLMRRYGSEEVRQWFFEVHEMEDMDIKGNSFSFNPLDISKHQQYFHRFTVIASAFRSLLPEVQIGGGGFPVQHYGESGLRHIFDLWAGEKEQPDFITITAFPYDLEEKDNYYYEKRSTDRDFLLHSIQLVKRAMGQSSLPPKPLHVTEYNITLSGRSVINDSCYRGAFLLRTIIAISQESEVILGIWTFSDLLADDFDSLHLLFGGPGLVNKNGIPKPAWYAVDFFSYCYPNILEKSENVLVTTNGKGSFYIFCHNAKTLTYEYYAAREEQLSYDGLPKMFEDLNQLKLHLTLENLPEVNYRIRQRRVNRDHGNLLQEWHDIDMEPEVSRGELIHLQKATTYKMSAQNIMAAEGRLVLDLTLEANEISCIQVRPTTLENPGGR